MTNPGLDLTLLTVDPLPKEMARLGLGQGQNIRNTDLEQRIYILGHAKIGETHGPLSIGKGRITEMGEIFLRFATETEHWEPGSAGFDERGNFAFVVCNPKSMPSTPPIEEVGKPPKRPQKETIVHTGVLVQSIRRWIDHNWEGRTFDNLVPPLGSHPPSNEPLPEILTSQTQPNHLKQKWSDDYNKAPTYAELTLFMDVYNRLAALRRECSKAERERKHQERHRIQGTSKPWLDAADLAELPTPGMTSKMPDFYAYVLFNRLYTPQSVDTD